MDLSFGLGQARRAAAVELDYPRLIAIVASAQAASRTAEVAGRIWQRDEVAADRIEVLVRMFDPGSDWLAAARRLGGSFNPSVAATLRKAT